MTDPVSERLEKVIRKLEWLWVTPSIIPGKNSCFTEQQVQIVVDTVLPILRDEIAAAEQSGYEEGWLDKAELDAGNRTTGRVAPGALARHDAAVMERMLEEIYKRFLKSEGDCGAWISDQLRTLKTPQPVVKS